MCREPNQACRGGRGAGGCWACELKPFSQGGIGGRFGQGWNIGRGTQVASERGLSEEGKGGQSFPAMAVTANMVRDIAGERQLDSQRWKMPDLIGRTCIIGVGGVEEEGRKKGRKGETERGDCWRQLSKSLLVQGCSAGRPNRGNNPMHPAFWSWSRVGSTLKPFTTLHRGAKWVSLSPRGKNERKRVEGSGEENTQNLWFSCSAHYTLLDSPLHLMVNILLPSWSMPVPMILKSPHHITNTKKISSWSTSPRRDSWFLLSNLMGSRQLHL